MGTLGAFDAGLLADAAHPLVGARRRVTGPTCLAALKSTRVDVVAPAKERPEEGDLGHLPRAESRRLLSPVPRQDGAAQKAVLLQSLVLRRSRRFIWQRQT
jgi:hypothetical protein